MASQSDSPEPHRVTLSGRPIACLISNRHLLTGDSDRAQIESLVQLIGAAARADVDLIQIREPDLPARGLEDLVRRAVAAAAETTARIVVNDRVDVALATGAGGVHLRSAGYPPSRLRADVPPDFLIGCSVHSAAEAAAKCAGADYIVLGTVFPTLSKPQGHPIAGLRELAHSVRTVSCPVLAIGGVDFSNLSSIAAAGAAGFAAIRFFIDAGRRPEDFTARVKTAKGVFDSRHKVP